MQKDVGIEVNRASWKRKRIPASIASLVGIRRVDVEIALLHTAIWTRPPYSTGFELADCWAWLRYLRCFAASPQLRLRPEWDDVDFHQKTILSDELGVGFTTQLFIEALGFIEYADTLWVLRVLPGYFQIVGNKKKGPKKTPDYIARDRQGRFSVLECKGSQTSTHTLRGAVNNGIRQKKNIKSITDRRFVHSLVAGLFLPQYSNREEASLCISDPDPDYINKSLFEVSRDDLTVAIAQVSLAKQFALMGFLSFANELANVPLTERDSLPDTFRQNSDVLRVVENEFIEFETRFPLPPQDTNDRFSSEATSVRLNATCPLWLYHDLTSSREPRQHVLGLARQAVKQSWIRIVEGNVAKVQSPYGFAFGLIYESARL